jgi:alkanesulfonate monooxygenase SsuD/methylene tetrahydromethanopterin reductase-like flavin-dependent oxidoreductase (luciferase family)
MMKKIQLGFCVPIFASPGGRLFRTPNYTQLDTATTMALAKTADDLGYDSLWVADHLMLGRDNAILEGWTTLAALAGATKQARLGMIHMAHLFRYPAMTAKMAATLDQISGGRLIHFIDGGNRPPEYAAYGLPWHDSMEDRVSHLVDGLQLTLALWTSEQPVNFDGRYYHLQEAVCAPRPLQQPHPPVWIGGANPLMLEACARYAQGWNTTPITLARLQEHLQALAEACQRVGRPFAELEKSLEMQILVAPDLATIRQQLKAMIALDPPAASADPGLDAFLNGETDAVPDSLARTSLVGTPDMVIQQMQAYVQAGISHFMLWFMDVPRQEGLRLFAEQVAPRLQ